MVMSDRTDCHCFCQVRHPAMPEICTNYRATTVAYASDITGPVDVPLCNPCWNAGDARQPMEVARG
jgi:hypothetical protein